MKVAYAGLAGTLLSVAVLTATASSAQAAARDGVCDAGEFCLYYNSGQLGSVSDFTTSIDDYGSTQPSCYVFKGPGSGKDLCVKNNAASVWNRTSSTVTVFYNSNYGGSSQAFATGVKANFNTTLKNNNASHRIGGSTGTENLSFGLYNLSGGRITAGFDGYSNPDWRHEGIDIARASGSPVRALIGGTVTNVVRSSSSSSLSTIAIYNATFDKTIVYLHTNPLSGVSTGDSISRDQQIATESDRGAPGAIHTHVEMRLGRQTLAAVSKDTVLVNPNPNSFWRDRGYNIQ